MSFDLDDYTHLLHFARQAHEARKIGVIYAVGTADWWRGVRPDLDPDDLCKLLMSQGLENEENPGSHYWRGALDAAVVVELGWHRLEDIRQQTNRASREPNPMFEEMFKLREITQ